MVGSQGLSTEFHPQTQVSAWMVPWGPLEGLWAEKAQGRWWGWAGSMLLPGSVGEVTPWPGPSPHEPGTLRLLGPPGTACPRREGTLAVCSPAQAQTAAKLSPQDPSHPGCRLLGVVVHCVYFEPWGLR